MVLGGTLLAGASCLPPGARAQDFFSTLFGGFGPRPQPRQQIVVPFGNEAAPVVPRSRTRYGGDIDDAATESGKSYSDLPNAFRYRKEIVAGCTCNGKDNFGLAQVSVENDPTLRKGDIVAGANGLVVAGRSAGKHVSMHFSPASKSIQARYRRVPVVASE